MSAKEFRSTQDMAKDKEMWKQHPRLVSYKDFYDSKTGQHVARVKSGFVVTDDFSSVIELVSTEPIDEAQDEDRR